MRRAGCTPIAWRSSAGCSRCANRVGAVGTYGFDRHGDTTTRAVGLYGIRDGALTPAGTVSG